MEAVVVLALRFPNKFELSIAAVPRLKPTDTGGLVVGDTVAGPTVPKSPPLAGGAEVKNEDLTGAGVEAGVVESSLNDSTGLDGSSVESISASLDTGVSATGILAASPRALPKLPPKNGFLVPSDGPGPSSLAELSALNVEPRTKPLEPIPALPPNTLVALFSTLCLQNYQMQCQCPSQK